MRILLSIILSASLICALLPHKSAYAAEQGSLVVAASSVGGTFTEGGVGYTVTSQGEVSVGVQSSAGTSFAGTGSVSVPASVSHGGVTYAVTGVTNYAFSGGGSTVAHITSLSLPSSVTSIGNYAFAGCDALESVTIGAGSHLDSIGMMAFLDCTSLTSFNVPARVTDIAQYAFANCTGLESFTFENPQATSPALYVGTGFLRVPGGSENALSRIELPARLRSLSGSALEQRSALEEVAFAGGAVNSIGSYAFRGCSGIRTFMVPAIANGMNGLAKDSFYGMDNLEAIVFLSDEDYNLDDSQFATGYSDEHGFRPNYTYPNVKSIVYHGSHTSSIFADVNHYEPVSYFASSADAAGGENALSCVYVREGVALAGLAQNVGRSDETGPFVYDGSVPDPGTGKVWRYEGGSLTKGATGPVSAYPVDANDLSAGEIMLPGEKIVYGGEPFALDYSVVDGAGKPVPESDFTAMLTDSSGASVNLGAIRALGAYTISVVGRSAYKGSLSASFSVVGPSASWMRLSGDAAFSTLGHMQESAYAEDSVSTMIIAGKRFAAVAAAAGGLAGVRKAPIVLTDGSSLSTESRYQLGYYQPSSVLFVGVDDYDTLSSETKQLLGSMTQVSNAFADTTAAGIGEKLYTRTKRSGYWSSTTAIITAHDDLAAASLAGTHGYRTASPVFLTDTATSVPAAVASAIATDGFTRVILVGLSASRVSAVSSQLAQAGFKGTVDSWYESNPYALSVKVAEAEVAEGVCSYDKATVVSAYDMRGLTSAVCTCAENKAPLLIADDVQGGDAAINRFIASNYHKISQGYIFGARRFVPAELESRIERIWGASDESTLASASMSLSATEFASDGGSHLPAATIVDSSGKKLAEGTDYTLSCYANANDARVTSAGGPSTTGYYTLVATGLGDYTGQCAATFRIGAPSLDSAQLVVSPAVASYTGSSVAPYVSVMLDGVELAEGLEYTLAITNNVNVGTASVKATGIRNYTGAASSSFSIMRISIDEATLSLSQVVFTYNGKAQVPATTVKLGSTMLVAGRDYNVTVKNAKGSVVKSPKDAGSYTVVVTAAGNYQGTLSSVFTIKKASQTIKAKMRAVTYKAKKLRASKNGGTFNIGAKAQTKVTYSLPKKAKKAGISITKKGKVRVKKKCKKGTYKITVTAAASANYLAATKTITVKVK